MPVSGFKRGDYVRTPAGKKAIVVSTRRRGNAIASVEYSDGHRQTFDQRSLRYWENR